MEYTEGIVKSSSCLEYTEGIVKGRPPIIAKNKSFTTRREAVLTAMEYFEAQDTSCTVKESKPDMVHYRCSAPGCPGAIILRFIEK